MDTIQYRARKIAEDISLALQGSLLVRHGHPAVAEPFLATRMGGQWGGAFGTLPTGLDLAPILERALARADRHRHSSSRALTATQDSDDEWPVVQSYYRFPTRVASWYEAECQSV
jgi:hypothetical protein